MADFTEKIPLELPLSCPKCKETVLLSVEHVEDPFTCPHCGKAFPLPDDVKAQIPAALEALRLYRDTRNQK